MGPLVSEEVAGDREAAGWCEGTCRCPRAPPCPSPALAKPVLLGAPASRLSLSVWVCVSERGVGAWRGGQAAQGPNRAGAGGAPCALLALPGMPGRLRRTRGQPPRGRAGRAAGCCWIARARGTCSRGTSRPGWPGRRRPSPRTGPGRTRTCKGRGSPSGAAAPGPRPRPPRGLRASAAAEPRAGRARAGGLLGRLRRPSTWRRGLALPPAAGAAHPHPAGAPGRGRRRGRPARSRRGGVGPQTAPQAPPSSAAPACAQLSGLASPGRAGPLGARGARVSPALRPRTGRPLLERLVSCASCAPRSPGPNPDATSPGGSPIPPGAPPCADAFWVAVSSLLVRLPGKHLKDRQPRIHPCPQGPA